MSFEMSPAAWVALACLAGTVLASFLVLFSAWRKGLQPPKPRPMPKQKGTPSFTRSWDKEEQKIQELAKAVKDLKERK